jgi:hypothetical protein
MRCNNCGAPSTGTIECEYCKSVAPHSENTSHTDSIDKEDQGSTILSGDVILILKKIDYIKSTIAPDAVKFQKIEILKKQLRELGYGI